METRNNIFSEVEAIQDKYEGRVRELDVRYAEHGCLQDLLDWRRTYTDYIYELTNLFRERDYIVPYEVYEFFAKVSRGKWRVFLSYINDIHNSGKIAGAFLKEAFKDAEYWSIPPLLLIERNNNYEQDQPATLPFSDQAYDAILETLVKYKNAFDYGLNDKDVSQAYADAALWILLWGGAAKADKAYEYYTTALSFLSSTTADFLYHYGEGYSTYSITRYDLLYRYRSDIKEYGVKCDFDIDKEIHDCLSENYQEAQRVLNACKAEEGALIPWKK